jgi:hypothetical protein
MELTAAENIGTEITICYIWLQTELPVALNNNKSDIRQTSKGWRFIIVKIASNLAALIPY